MPLDGQTGGGSASLSGTVTANQGTANATPWNINSPDSTTNGSLSSTGSFALTPPGGDATWTFVISGTLTGTVVFEGTLDNTNYFSLYASRFDNQTNTPITTVTGAAGTGCNGSYKSITSGLSQVRVRVSAYTSGTITCYMRISSGAGPVFQLYPLPPGSNAIGTVTTNDAVVATGGGSVYRNINLSTTGVNIKGSAGKVTGWFISNNAAYAIFVKFYNKASAPTVGTDTPFLTLEIPASASANVGKIDIGFGTGIGIGATKLVADADTTVLASNDCIVNVMYA